MSLTPRRRAVVPAALALAAVALSSCAASGSASDASADAGEPVEGGTLTVGLGTDTSIIDPHITGSSVTATIARLAVDSLVGQAEDGSFTPWLAEDWEVSDDNTLYTFDLRDGVTFSDGETLDADAVKANLDRILDPDTSSSYAKSLLGPVAAVEAVDDDTVTVAYDEPFSPLLQGLSLPYLGIQSPAYLAETEDTTTTIVGSGPYVLESFAPGQGAVLTKRDDYDWAPGYAAHDGPAYLDEIDFTILPEASSRLGALTSGQVQAIDAVPPANAESLAGNDTVELTTDENPGVNYAYQLNTTAAPFDDVRVRQAFQSAVDVDTAVQSAYFGTLEPADNILAPDTLGYDADVADLWGYDPDRANALLDEAGWTERDDEGYRTKDGERLSLRWVYDEASSGELNVNLTQLVQSQVKEDAGIEIVLDPVDAGGYTERTASGDYELVSYYYTRAEPDILRTVYGSDSIPPDGSGNTSRVTSLDDQLNEAVGASEDRRIELYSEVQREIVEQAYSVPLYIAAYQLAQSTSLEGVGWATNAKPLFYDAWLSE